MTAKRKGRVLAGDSAVIHSPYNRYQFHLRLSAADRDKLRRADPPIMIKLVLRVRDEAGNVGTDQKRISSSTTSVFGLVLMRRPPAPR